MFGRVRVDDTPVGPTLWGLAANPALPADLIDRLVAFAPCRALDRLAERDDLSSSQLRALVDRGDSDVAVRLVRLGRLRPRDVPHADVSVVIAAVNEGLLPARVAADLVGHPDRQVRAALAGCRHLPEGALAALAGDPEPAVAAEAAGSPALTGQVAERLARHPHLTVRRRLAGNDHTPAHVLAALAADGGGRELRWCEGCDATADPQIWMDWDPTTQSWRTVRCDGANHERAGWQLHHALVANPATPAQTAAAFATHPHFGVRQALAARIDQSPTVYAQLAADPEAGIRAELAGNPAVSTSLIRRLADGGSQARQRVLNNPAAPLAVLRAAAGGVRLGAHPLPRIAAATNAEIDRLARSGDPTDRMLAATRRDMPLDLVNRLAGDPDARVAKALAPNPTLTEAQLRAMLTAHGVRVACRIAANPGCSADLLEKLATHQPRVQKVYRVIAAHPNATAVALGYCLDDQQGRPVAAGHSALPVEVVVALLDDPDWGTAAAAASNPSLPRAAMESILSHLPPTLPKSSRTAGAGSN